MFADENSLRNLHNLSYQKAENHTSAHPPCFVTLARGDAFALASQNLASY